MLHRRPLVAKVLADRPDDLLVVSGLGSSTWDVSSVGNHASNFCFIGAMGQAAPFALGLALAQTGKRILLITGDGELLMSLGVLATIANKAPGNLGLMVLDNQSYVETGNQPTATAGATNLPAIAAACGIAKTREFSKESEIDELSNFVRTETGPVFANVKIVAESLPLAFPYSFDGVTAMDRFRANAID